MAEGLSSTEAARQLGEHAEHVRERAAGDRHVQLVSAVEAVLLAVVTLTAAWSGFAAAKWTTESSLELARASASRTAASRAFQQSLILRSQDASNFNAWFSAYLTKNAAGERVAEGRFRPQYDVAFRAWLATRPFANPHAPKGPQAMPQYHPTGLASSRALAARAEHQLETGEQAATTGDDYIRVTVVLASVLFLVGLSSHFPHTRIRWGLIGVSAALLVVAAVEILRLPAPPGV